jgi:type VI secretion system protein ImpJ
MRNPAVQWSEGMFLRPHHFQAADRHRHEQLAISGHWDNPYNYGLHRCELSEEALAHSQLQISGLACRLRDGTLFSVESGQELDRRDLKEAFEAESVLTVYLAIPKLVLGQANVSVPGTDAGPRHYTTQSLALQDEVSGGNDQELELQQLQPHLLLSTDNLQGYEVLPLVRIKRSGAEEATPEVDDDYIPPLLAIDVWPPLGLDIVRAIYDLLGEKIEVLGERVRDRGITLASTDPGDLDDLLMLKALNEGEAVLHCQTFAKGVHPYWAYLELCRLVGSLSLFDSQRTAGDIPAYDHDELARIFKWVKDRITKLLRGKGKLQYQQRYFSGTDQGMQVAIEPEWLHAGWDWYVGVNGKNISDEKLRELLHKDKDGKRKVDWKMGCSHQVDLIFRLGLPQVEQKELPRAPRELPSHQGWIYYEIVREGRAWKDVLASQTLAMQFTTEFIGNLDKLPGNRNLEIMLPDQRATLQVALFAVERSAS